MCKMKHLLVNKQCLSDLSIFFPCFCLCCISCFSFFNILYDAFAQFFLYGSGNKSLLYLKKCRVAVEYRFKERVFQDAVSLTFILDL